MKTMTKKDGRKKLIIRVANDQVKKYLELGYTYCSKQVWKKNVRDKNVIKTKNMVETTIVNNEDNQSNTLVEK